jgi:hypothetical protein
MNFPIWLSPSVSTFYNDAQCFLLQVKVFCYSVGAEASYVCFPMLSVFCCVTMKSAFFLCFLSPFDNLPHIFVLKKIISELCILFLSQILDAVSSLVFSYIVQFHYHFNSCLVSRVQFVVWFITLLSLSFYIL